jgi:hypothetical protein
MGPPVTELYMSAADFSAARSDPRLHRLLTLARIVNSIRFTEVAVVEHKASETAKATRQKMSAFLYLAALLYEGLNFAQRLGQHFRDSEAFRVGFADLFRDAVVVELRAGLLNRLRNQAVYHHDDVAIPTGLNLMSADEYNLRGRGRTATGDAWLAAIVPRLLASPAFEHDGAIFITFDEGNSNAGCCGTGGGGQVFMVAVGDAVRAGFRSAVPATHYSLLRTIEDGWGLQPLGEAASSLAIYR